MGFQVIRCTYHFSRIGIFSFKQSNIRGLSKSEEKALLFLWHVNIFRRLCTLAKGRHTLVFLSPYIKVKLSLCLRARRLIRPALISGLINMKRLGVFLLPPGWDAGPSQSYPQHFAGNHLYTWVERGTVRVKCLAQRTQHNVPNQDPKPDHSIRSRALTMRLPRLPPYMLDPRNPRDQ